MTRTAKYRGTPQGKNADYIPALAKVDPNIFGIALVTTDGRVYTAGDLKSEVSIQSISKVFTLAKVIEEQGPEAIEKTIGVDATGMRFNSIVAVEMAHSVLGGPETELARQPRRDRHYQHGERRRPGTRSGTTSWASTPTSPAGLSRSIRKYSSLSQIRTSAIRRSVT